MRGEVTWSPTLDTLGRAVVAIGVFDGVHLGHQALLHDTVKEAHKLRARSIAITFDRDPDQVVTPDTAAPQLLTLTDKVRFIRACGVDTVLVVPFTPQMAATPAQDFLEAVLCACCDARSIHVGADFHFGARAEGDVDTLYIWAAENNAEVRPHKLVEALGAPITSTRIRSLVAEGQVAQAALLLGRPTRVSGLVHRGRQQGREIGIPTANVVAPHFAALPAEGVYAGRVELPNGHVWPAAISVGLPPSFPQAVDRLEAHLIGFEGDLYDQTVSIEFLERLHEQRAFKGTDALASAIRADIARSLEIAGAYVDEEPPFPEEPHLLPDWLDGDVMPNGEPVIDDLDALRAAEASVSGVRPEEAYRDVDDSWVPVASPQRLSGIFADAGFRAALLSAPLQAAEIPFAWDPYPPEDMPSFRVGYGAVDRPFTLLVPAERVDEARALLGITEEPRPMSYHPVAPPQLPRDTRGLSRKTIAWIIFFVFVGANLLLTLVAWLLARLNG